MRVVRIIEALREIPIPLEYYEGKVEHSESTNYDDRLQEGNRWFKTPIELISTLSVDEVYTKLIASPFFNWRVKRDKGAVDFRSFPVSSKTGRMYFNMRFVRLSGKTCVMVGYLTHIRKDLL